MKENFFMLSFIVKTVLKNFVTKMLKRYLGFLSHLGVTNKVKISHLREIYAEYEMLNLIFCK
jgi:hypothetical protein